jgi:5-methylcytosine-specific restriction endonuclease McrA
MSAADAGLGAVYCAYRERARRYARPFRLSRDEARLLFTRECFYCGQPPALAGWAGWKDFHYNGIDRVDSSKGYSVDNCVTACRRCNVAKSDATQAEFIEWGRRFAAYQARTTTADPWPNPDTALFWLNDG